MSGHHRGGHGGHGGRGGGHHGHGGGDSTGTSYASGGAFGGLSDDFSAAEEHAAQTAGDSGDRGMFSSALSMLQENKDSLANQEVDENHAIQSHSAFYGDGGGMTANSGALGSAAAMQALKMFTGGGSSSGGSSSGGGIMDMAMGMMGGGGSSGSSGAGGLLSSMMGGGSSSSGAGQNQFIGAAMGEASKLFDQQNAAGNVPSGTSKQDVVHNAAQQAALMYMKSEMGGSSGGGLMSLASKFM